MITPSVIPIAAAISAMSRVFPKPSKYIFHLSCTIKALAKRVQSSFIIPLFVWKGEGDKHLHPSAVGYYSAAASIV